MCCNSTSRARQVDVGVEVIDIAESAEVPAAVVSRLVQTQMRQRAVAGLAGVLQVQVPEHGAGILWIDGKVDRLLTPGSYAFWKFNRNVAVEAVDLRLQAVEVTGQDILTRDKVGLRLNLSATWRYVDVLKAYTQLAKPAEHLYRELQFGLRAAVGTRTLDELLENKTVIDEVVTAHMEAKLAAYGIELDGVGVKDIVLPGEMKTILAQVVEAEKAAQANVTRKGAVSAKAGQLGIIPGSMGARSYIVRGKGNPDSFESCSHGAGRAMSRGEAKRRFTLADHRAATEGVECRKDKDVIDETPAAYKDIDAVMEAQRDLVDVVHVLKQVVCVKG
jgi:regulator of protease activity HflC (stomatin/prohibitin superfamily)